MNTLRIIVCGAAGKTGSRVLALAAADPRFKLIAGVENRAAQAPCPVINEKELGAGDAKADVWIDFSTAEASARFAKLAAAARKPFVTGTTGRTPAQEAAVRSAAKRIPVLSSPNFSLGMNVLLHLARIASAALPNFDPAILDVHHTAKKDAPSGTALRLADAVRAGSSRDPQIVSERAGDVVGDHTLLLAGPNERIELIHRAHSRDVFARGALEAALWLKGRKPGLYGMQDLLRLG
ncbi:MAG: 4-hydroxy-tetrahydrodipicolinate reductase [Elusimicrobia bacterium]|nr:4-hydroxy-tetrahydrodipicolinate reductase [Elusimicrobiota bacterium]